MEFLDLQKENERALRIVRFREQFDRLRIEASALYPEHQLVLVSRRDEGPALISVPESRKPDPEFRRRPGIDQIAEALKRGPLEKAKLLREIHNLGGAMPNAAFSTYLQRGKARGIFTNFGDRIWALKGQITDGSDVLNFDNQQALSSVNGSEKGAAT
jgi:hypothetical protein